MGDLLKSFTKAKLSLELALQEEQEDDQGDSSSASSMSSTGTVVPSPGHKPAPTLPLSWTEFFAQELYLEKQGEGYSAKYHVYTASPPLVKTWSI